jgi:gluconokinase
MDYIIGIDIGTTHAKAVTINREGKLLQETKSGYPTLHPQPGYSEQEPDKILQAVIALLKNAGNIQSASDKIVCISFSAAMHSLLLVNSNGIPLTNALTWADTRSVKYTQSLQHTDMGKRIYAATGTPIHPMTPLCKIAWIRDNLPELFRLKPFFISIKEYIIYKITRKLLVDYSIASATGLFNNQLLQWNKESLEFAGIDAAQLSMPVAPGYIIKECLNSFLQETGLPSNLQIVMGAGDGAMANVGSGAVLPGDLAITVGTSGAIRKFNPVAITRPDAALFNYLVDAETYLCGGAINNGGILLEWFVTNFLKTDFTGSNVMEAYMQEAAMVTAGSNGLIFLPYVYGERAPVWDANAKGVFFGITGMHNRSHFMRAILEAVCFALLQVANLMETSDQTATTLYASGGFTASPLWLQIMSDVFNKPIKVCGTADASAMGAAFLGLKALGQIREWKEIKNFIQIEKEYLPNGQANKQYEMNFEIYKGLYQKLKNDF